MTAPPAGLPGPERVEDLLRELAPQVLATVLRRFGMFDLCEDAVQEALFAAADRRMATHHRLLAVRAHLRNLAGDRVGAEADFRAAARRTNSTPERHYLLGKTRQAACDDGGSAAPVPATKAAD